MRRHSLHLIVALEIQESCADRGKHGMDASVEDRFFNLYHGEILT